jgi:hypothetical protein
MKPLCQNEGCGSSDFNARGRCVVCNEFPTLGWEVGAWIEEHCAIPDRDQVGDQFKLTEEQWRFLLNHYRVNPRAAVDEVKSEKAGYAVWRNQWRYSRGSQLVRPQGWGKSPFSGAIICAEAAGPAYFDGWGDDGSPRGRPWPTPLIQITALSEDNTDNVWLFLLPMIRLGNFEHDIPDTGQLRIYLPNGGRIEPVTSSAKSRLGQPATCVVQDQTESWLARNGGRNLADVQRRNMAKFGGRWISICNAWDPGEESVAQYTFEYEVKKGGVYHDDIEPSEELSIRNKAHRRKALQQVYGDSWWVPLERIDEEIVALLDRDAAQAERWFLNRKRAREQAAFDGVAWDKLAERKETPAQTLIVVGVDGARFDDDLGFIGTEVETGYQWVLGHWHRPDNALDNYEHPMDEADGVMVEANERFEIWRIYIDPGSTAGNIEPLVEKWQGRWGAQKVLAWRMNQPRKTSYAVANFTNAINAGDLRHDGDAAFAQHIRNATKQMVPYYDEDGRRMHLISKDRPQSPNKMDLAAAAVLSWEARGDAVAAGAKPPAQYQAAGFH